MKKSLPIALFLLALLIVLPPTFAQEDASGPANLVPRGPRIEQRMEKLDARVQNIASRLDSIREKIASRAAALKTKLATFRDKNKAKRVEKINDTLADINLKRTQKMQDHLTQMENLLTKTENKLGDAQDKTAAQGAITDAKGAIDTAKTAAATQLEKDYTISATSEATIKADSMTARNQLHTDLKALHNLVVAARQSVANAVSTTVSALGGSNNGQ